MYGWLGTRTCMSNVKTSLYTRQNTLEKREDTVFKTKYYISYLFTNFVQEMGHMKFSVYFGTHNIYIKGHKYAPWQYEHMPHKSMMNRLIRTKLSTVA